MPRLPLLLSGLVLLAPVVASADCPDPVAALQQTEPLINSGALKEAAAALAGAEAGFGCGAVVTTALLGRFWRAEGALLLARGRGEEASLSFAAARRVDPEGWTAGFSGAVRAAWREAQPPGGDPSLLRLDPWSSRYRAFVDGRSTALPAAVTPGLHLVQARDDTGDEVRFARFVLTDAGLPLVLNTPLLPDPVPEPPETAALNPGHGRPVALFAAGGGAALAGGGLLLLSARLNDAYPDAVAEVEAGQRSAERGRRRVTQTHAAQVASSLGGGALVLGGAGLAVGGVILW